MVLPHEAVDRSVRSDVAAAVGQVRHAGGRAELAVGMARLEAVATGERGRAALRSELGAARYVELARNVVRRFPGESDKHAWCRRLLELTFGPDRSDLSDPDVFDFAVDVLQEGPPSDLGVYVLADLMTVHEPQFVQRKFAERWLGEHGLLAAVAPVGTGAPASTTDTPAAGTAPTRERRTRRGIRARPRRIPSPRSAAEGGTRAPSWMLPALVLAALVVVLGLGVYVGLSLLSASPDEDVVAAPAPASATADPVPATLAAPVPPAAGPASSGTVGERTLEVRLAATPGQPNVVYMLLRPRSGDTHYYRRQCARSEAEWVCREQNDKPAPPPDSLGYDVVLVSALENREEVADGLSTVDPPRPEDIVAPPIGVPL